VRFNFTDGMEELRNSVTLRRRPSGFEDGRRHAETLRIGPKLIFLFALTACQPTSSVAPSSPTSQLSDEFFNDCVAREARETIARAATSPGGLHDDADLKKGLTTENVLGRGAEMAVRSEAKKIQLVNEVLTRCSKQSAGDALTQNGGRAYVERAVSAQILNWKRGEEQRNAENRRKHTEIDAPRLKAESDIAFDRYRVCLINHAKVMSLSSNEPAEVIAKATFPSCSGERQAVFDTYQRHNEYFSIGAMGAAEEKFYQQLLLEIIKARAPYPASPEPPPIKRDTPI
jgi:hypothetical protein